jgi:hypothetical protein
MSHPFRRFGSASWLAGAVFLTFLAGACGGVGPDENNTTSTFSERLEVGGSDTFQFSVGKNGEFSVRITSLSNSNAILGVWVGQPGLNACTPIVGYVAPVAVLDRDALSSFIQKGSYCLQVYDSGSLRETVDYTVRVSHP